MTSKTVYNIYNLYKEYAEEHNLPLKPSEEKYAEIILMLLKLPAVLSQLPENLRSKNDFLKRWAIYSDASYRWWYYPHDIDEGIEGLKKFKTKNPDIIDIHYAEIIKDNRVFIDVI